MMLVLMDMPRSHSSEPTQHPHQPQLPRLHLLLHRLHQEVRHGHAVRQKVWLLREMSVRSQVPVSSATVSPVPIPTAVCSRRSRVTMVHSVLLSPHPTRTSVSIARSLEVSRHHHHRRQRRAQARHQPQLRHRHLLHHQVVGRQVLEYLRLPTQGRLLL